MCGRATLAHHDLTEVAEMVNAAIDPAAQQLFRRRYNIAPSDLHWVLRPRAGHSGPDGAPHGSPRIIGPAFWGLMNRAPGHSGGMVVNVRGESILRGAFRHHQRAVVPVDGFFEWIKPAGAQHKLRQPVWYHRPDGGILFLGALVEETTDGPRFTVVTTEANDVVRPVHHRMPVIVPVERLNEWFQGPSRQLLTPAPRGLLIPTKVSPRVNSPRNDDPMVLTPESEQGQ